jgi:excisionase family DNA binding protein
MDNSNENLPDAVPIDPVYSVKETAGLLKTTERTVLELIRKKRLAAVKVGREYRITETTIEKFLKGGR